MTFSQRFAVTLVLKVAFARFFYELLRLGHNEFVLRMSQNFNGLIANQENARRASRCMTQAGIEKSSTATPRALTKDLTETDGNARGSTRSLLITSTPLGVWAVACNIGEAHRALNSRLFKSL